MIDIILLLYKWYFWMEPTTYYYDNGNNIMNVSLIILLMNISLIGSLFKKYIFGDRLYYIKNNKLKKYDVKVKDNIFCKKIIKDIEYNDFNYKYNLNVIKENIYNIHSSIPLSFILLYYRNIVVNNNSTLHIKYFNNDTKILKILSTTKFEDILN